MATNDLLQKLDGGADFGVTTSNRRQTEVFIAKETVAVGDWVALDYGATDDGDVTLGIFKADGNSNPVRTPFGVVVGTLDTTLTGAADLTTGARIEVCIKGVCNALFAANGSGADYPLGTLMQVTNNAGEAGVAAAGSAQPVCGILAQVQPNGAGAQLRRVVVRKSF